jgi:hypothetical protein
MLKTNASALGWLQRRSSEKVDGFSHDVALVAAAT